MSKEFQINSSNSRVLDAADLTNKQKHDCAQTIAMNAQDVPDCAMLLDMLGLTPQDGGADMTRALERGL